MTLQVANEMLLSVKERRKKKKISSDPWVSIENIWLCPYGIPTLLFCNYPTLHWWKAGKQRILGYHPSPLTQPVANHLAQVIKLATTEYSLLFCEELSQCNWILLYVPLMAYLYNPYCSDVLLQFVHIACRIST